MNKTYALVAALALIVSAPAFAEEITSDWNGVLVSQLRIRSKIEVPRFADSLLFVGGRTLSADTEVPRGTPYCHLWIGNPSSVPRELGSNDLFAFSGVASQFSAQAGGSMTAKFGGYDSRSKQLGSYPLLPNYATLTCQRNGRGTMTTELIAKILGKKAELVIADEAEQLQLIYRSQTRSYVRDDRHASVSNRDTAKPDPQVKSDDTVRSAETAI